MLIRRQELISIQPKDDVDHTVVVAVGILVEDILIQLSFSGVVDFFFLNKPAVLTLMQ